MMHFNEIKNMPVCRLWKKIIHLDSDNKFEIQVKMVEIPSRQLCIQIYIT